MVDALAEVPMRVEIEEHEGALEVPTGNARSRWTRRRGLLVRIAGAGGLVGLGEASPLPGYSRDSWEDARADLYRASRALASVPVEVGARAGVDTLEVAERLLAPLELGPSARFGLEAALFDLHARAAGEPVHRWLAPGHDMRPLPLAELIDDADPDRVIYRARRAVESGARTLKLKIGRNLGAEIELLRVLRAQVGDSVELRLDANGQIGAYGAPELLERVAEVAWPELVEDPVSLRALELLPPLPVAVALDEPLQALGPDTLVRLLDTGRVRVLVIKPAAIGGIGRSLELVRIAVACGAGVVVSHLLDGPVGWAAAGELALAVGGQLAVGLGAHPGLSAWPSVRPAVFGAGDGTAPRVIAPHDRPGLGVEPDALASGARTAVGAAP